MYVLTTPKLDAMGHRWVGALASFEFTLEYQKGMDNTAIDTFSRVPINQIETWYVHSWREQSLAQQKGERHLQAKLCE